MESARSKTMATPLLIAPARLGYIPTPCGIRPTRPPASRVRNALEFWPFSAFARAACPHAPLQLADHSRAALHLDLKDFKGS